MAYPTEDFRITQLKEKVEFLREAAAAWETTARALERQLENTLRVELTTEQRRTVESVREACKDTREGTWFRARALLQIVDECFPPPPKPATDEEIIAELERLPRHRDSGGNVRKVIEMLKSRNK